MARFFTHLKDALERFQIQPERIWNMDETAFMTVHRPRSVVAQRGERNVASITTAEHGLLVTAAFSVSALGNCMPPFFIFPRARFRQHFLAAAPPGSDGAASPSGWSNGGIFLKFLEHFKRHAAPTRANRFLLILDSHESHLSVPALDFSRDNGIVMLTLPPHTTHKLQPLDRTVFGPVKRLFNAACDNWMRLPPNVGRPLRMYDIPALAANPIRDGATAANIMSGFAATGIFPLNENVFSDSDFVGAEVTERVTSRPTTPDPDLRGDDDNEQANDADWDTFFGELIAEPAHTTVEEASQAVDMDRTLEEVQPYPSTRPRVGKPRGRKPGQSMIATDRAVIAARRAEQDARDAKKREQAAKKSKRLDKRLEREWVKEQMEEKKEERKRKKEEGAVKRAAKLLAKRAQKSAPSGSTSLRTSAPAKRVKADADPQPGPSGVRCLRVKSKRPVYTQYSGDSSD